MAQNKQTVIFEGRTGNRPKSIKYGLVVFLKPDQHRTGNNSVHNNPKSWLWLKELGQKTYMEHYNKSIDEFISEFGRSYIDN